MAKAKYKKLADGTFRTRIWDGTYNEDGSKHRVHLRSDKSSAELERQFRELKQKVETGDIVKPSGVMLTEYASEWLSVYKSVRALNTRHMYRNIIEKHFCASRILQSAASLTCCKIRRLFSKACSSTT